MISSSLPPNELLELPIGVQLPLLLLQIEERSHYSLCVSFCNTLLLYSMFSCIYQISKGPLAALLQLIWILAVPVPPVKSTVYRLKSDVCPYVIMFFHMALCPRYAVPVP